MNTKDLNNNKIYNNVTIMTTALISMNQPTPRFVHSSGLN